MLMGSPSSVLSMRVGVGIPIRLFDMEETRRSFDVAQVRGRGATPREGACLLACITEIWPCISAQTNHLGFEKHVCSLHAATTRWMSSSASNSALKAAMRAAAARAPARACRLADAAGET